MTSEVLENQTNHLLPTKRQSPESQQTQVAYPFHSLGPWPPSVAGHGAFVGRQPLHHEGKCKRESARRAIHLLVACKIHARRTCNSRKSSSSCRYGCAEIGRTVHPRRRLRVFPLATVLTTSSYCLQKRAQRKTKFSNVLQPLRRIPRDATSYEINQLLTASVSPLDNGKFHSTNTFRSQLGEQLSGIDSREHMKQNCP